MSTIALYATDTMADWEYSYIVAGLAMAAEFDPNRYELRLVTDTSAPGEVTTMGRLRIRTDGTLADLDVDDISALILPGAQTWDARHGEALSLAGSLLANDVPVAGICGATLGLARSGILNDRSHTSNDLDFLRTTDAYTGAELYENARTVRDGPLITAPAFAPVDFATAVFQALELFPPAIIDAWHGLYTTGEKKYYDVLAGTDE